MEKDFTKFRSWMKTSVRCYTDERNGVLSVSSFNPEEIFGVVKRSYLEWSEKDRLIKSDWIMILEAMLELKEEEKQDAIRSYQIFRAEYDALENPSQRDHYNIDYRASYLEDYLRCINQDVEAIQEEVSKWS
jgi:hypothetical protein